MSIPLIKIKLLLSVVLQFNNFLVENMDSNSENMTNLHDLSFNGKLEQITKLSSIEKYINEPDSDGRTPLLLSCFQNHLNVAKYLINSNANVNCQDKNLTTPLHWGVFNNNIQLVQILIDKKAVIHAKDRNGIQPLHLASLKGNVQIIRLIMSKREIHETVVDNQGKISFNFWNSVTLSYKTHRLINC